MGMNQSSFAALCGATRKTQFNYESGARSPDSAYLETIHRAGADVLYILTGVRSLSAPRLSNGAAPHHLTAAEPPAPYGLTPDEAALLDNYRHSSEEAQAAIRATSAALAQPCKAAPAKGKGKS